MKGFTDRVRRLPGGVQWPSDNFQHVEAIAAEAEQLMAAANELKQAIGWHALKDGK